MAKKDLKVNSLRRFGEKESKLVLKEYNSCEVPAGCGGVVIRWQYPEKDSLYLVINFHSPHAFDLFVDGSRVHRSRIVLRCGNHIVALRISDPQPGTGLFLFSGSLQETEDSSKNARLINSSADGTWLYTLDDPADVSWIDLDYDDSSWLPMVQQELSRIDEATEEIQKLMTLGAVSLGVEKPCESGTLWIRKKFTSERDGE